MPKITIEIEDTLQERVDSAIDEVRDLLKSYVRREEPEDLPCLHNDLDYSGDVHAIIDGSVPFRTSEIEATWYLHGQDLEEAYETVGIGTNPRENHGMTAIYCFVEQKVAEWYHSHAQAVFDEALKEEGDDE
jgi:hypothetical protein